MTYSTILLNYKIDLYSYLEYLILYGNKFSELFFNVLPTGTIYL